jgi:hypothetical protein
MILLILILVRHVNYKIKTFKIFVILGFLKLINFFISKMPFARFKNSKVHSINENLGQNEIKLDQYHQEGKLG